MLGSTVPSCRLGKPIIASSDRSEHLEREVARERERTRELAAQNAKVADENTSLREELNVALANATLLRNALSLVEDNASSAGRDAGAARTNAGIAEQRAVQLAQAVQTARRGLVSLQTQLRLVHDESMTAGDPTEPGTPMSFEDIEGEP